MTVRRHLLALLACLLPMQARAADDVAAAITTRSFATRLAFEDGARGERTLRRAGVEYWEGIADGVFLGFAVGYSESEGRDAARPFELVSGNYGAIGLRFETQFDGRIQLRGRAGYLVQRDDRGDDDLEFTMRLDETRAELSPVLRLHRLELGIGASWRHLEYRETLEDAGGETVRHADARDDAGAFATLGWRTDNTGSIALRYDDGMEEGWSLRFERTY